MSWLICFAVSLIITALSVLEARKLWKQYRSNRLLTPFTTIFAGMYLAVSVLMLPVFAVDDAGKFGFSLPVVLYSLIQALQVFTINVDAGFILDNIGKAGETIRTMYFLYMTVLFIVAPLLTFNFLISMFSNFLARVRYRLKYYSEVYAFSQLNDKALMLARNLKEKHPDALIVFTNVTEEEGEGIDEELETARELKAVVFKKDLVSVNLLRHSNSAKITLFAIDEKENDNIIQGLKLLARFNARENTELYVYSGSPEGEMLLSNASKGKVKVRRINEYRSLVFRYLYDSGTDLFAGAKADTDGKKKITAVIAGLGSYGTELLKALAWYCQMDGYSVSIHAFDKDELAEDRFSALCPELMSPQYNGITVSGETEYTITIHSGVDVTTKTFADQLAAIEDVTAIYVCLGSDENNINQAANLRMLSERSRRKPEIYPIVYSTDETEALKGITNYRGQAYDLTPIGDLEISCSEEVLMGSELEKLALERHLKWGKEEEFWQYEYNYRSSMASAIHMKARIACGIAGACKTTEELTEEEQNSLEILEHRRWNAYMRSEGYVFSGSKDKASRNDLGKMHHDLVVFQELTDEEKRKDSKIATR